MLGSVLSFLPSLVTAERWPSPRVAFAGTIAVAGWLGTAQVAGRKAGIVRMMLTFPLLVYLSMAAYLGWNDALDYVRLYRRDQQTLASVEALARAHGVRDVYLGLRPPFSWNPYRLRFDLGNLDHHRSEFLVDWQTSWLLEVSSSRLRLGRDGVAARACHALAAAQRPRDGFDVVPLPDRKGVCVIPAG
jgi:hypothetical protein